MSMLTSFKDFEPSDEFTKKIEAVVKTEPRFSLEEPEEFVVAEKYEKSDDVLANTPIPDTVKELVLFKKEPEKKAPKSKELPDDYDYNQGVTYSTITCSYPLGNYLTSRKISLQVCSLHKDDPVCIEIECNRALERQKIFAKKKVVKKEKVKEEKLEVKKEFGIFQSTVSPIQEDS
jgi:hypothetical protein